MSVLNGIRITLNPGTNDEVVFRGRGNISIQEEIQSNYALSGFNTPLALFERYADKDGDALQTPYTTGHLIAGGGTRTIEIAFDQWSGSTDRFGPADPSDPPDEKLAVLAREIADAAVDSLNPATLEYGPYYDDPDARYDPIPVVFTQVSPTVDFGEAASVFRSRLTAQETVDLTAVIDGTGADAMDPDIRLTPASASTPQLPLPIDTLGFGGRGTGAQQQGKDVQRSALVDSNGTGSDPTSLPTKILPEEVQLRGAFRGAEAADLADQLKRDFLANDAIDAVEIEAPGLSAPVPLTGIYSLGSESRIDPITPQADGIYGFNLELIEN